MRGTVAKSFRKLARVEKTFDPKIDVAKRAEDLKKSYKKNTGHLIEQLPKLTISRRQQRLSTKKISK